MRSYLEILKELNETVKSDKIPRDDEEKIKNLINELVSLLWKYSD
jgi:hypothetical protein